MLREQPTPPPARAEPVPVDGLRDVVIVSAPHDARAALEHLLHLRLQPRTHATVLGLLRGEAPQAPPGPAGLPGAQPDRQDAPLVAVVPPADPHHPAQGVLQEAGRRPELLVVPRGRRTLGTRLFGSIPEHLARESHLPVLMTQRELPGPYRRVLVAVDLSDSSRAALELVLSLLPPGLEALQVLHACDTSYALVMRQSGASAERIRRYMEEVEDKALRAVDAFVAPYRGAGWPLEVLVRSGDPRELVCRTVGEQESDLVVLGKHGDPGLAHALLGSVTESCMRRVHCDVLVVPGRADTVH